MTNILNMDFIVKCFNESFFIIIIIILGCSAKSVAWISSDI